MIIENVTGAGGTIAAARVARAAPDGYTILVGNLATQVLSAGNYANLPYDPQRDFAPVMLVANTAEVLIINKDLPIETLQDFIAYSKSNGRTVTMGSAGVGSSSHLAYLLFNSISQAKAVHVPYRGDPDADTDLMGGRIDAVFNQTILASSYIRSGRVRALVLAASHRSAALPDVPSSVEAGMPDLQINAWTALFVPRDTPQPIIGRLNAAFEGAFVDSAVFKRLTELGVDIPSAEQRTPGALEHLVVSEFAKWLPLIRSADHSANTAK